MKIANLFSVAVREMKPRLREWSRIVLVVGILGAAGAAWAQVSGGSFRGEVQDPSGAVVPDAKITIKAIDTGVEAFSQTTSSGIYTTPTLIPGKYLLTAEKPGFKSVVFGPAELPVNQTVRVDFSLTVGEVTESLTVGVTGQQLLQTESSEISQVISHEQVSQMPLNGRNWQQLVGLSAGVTPGTPGQSGVGNGFNYNINGQRDKGNLYLVDGLSVTSAAGGNSNNFNIPLDAVQEFSVQSNSFSAEYADVAGGVINLQSKSGTNNFHGSAFEFLRNDAFDATNTFTKFFGQAKDALRYNQYGGSLGGPIRRNKTFFFADYQGLRQSSSAVRFSNVPTALERTGNFSQTLNPGTRLPVRLFDPYAFGSEFPGGVIPANRINPVSAALMALLPLPNLTGVSGSNYTNPVTNTVRNDSFDARLDHNFSQKDSLFLRYSFQDNSSVVPSTFGLPLGGGPFFSGPFNASRLQNAGLGYTRVFSPTLVNEMRVHLNRITGHILQEDYGLNLSDKFGIPAVNTNSATTGLPFMLVADYFSAGGSIITPIQSAFTNWGFTEKLSWTKGRHVMRIGGDYRYEVGNLFALVFGRGFQVFHPLNTSALGIFGPAGNGLASFELGAPLVYRKDNFPVSPSMVIPRYGLFFQDDYKVTSRLTLNLGLRYDVLPFYHERRNRLANFDPATGTNLVAGVTGSRNLVNTSYKDFGPRVGFAYSPTKDGKTVLRAGFGLGTLDSLGMPGSGNALTFNAPFYGQTSLTQLGPPFGPPIVSINDPLLVPLPPANDLSGSVRYVARDQRNPYSMTWNFGLQRALTSSLLLEAAYVGSAGNRLLVVLNSNQSGPSPATPARFARLAPNLGEVRTFANVAHSSYHGLQTKLQQRFDKGVFFLASYTWSKSIDNNSNGSDGAAALNGSQQPQDSFNLAAERGPSTFDRTHYFVFSGIWDLPVGRGKQYAEKISRGADFVIGGWQLSGIYSAYSGAPYSINYECGNLVGNSTDTTRCRPNIVGDPNTVSGGPSVEQWFNTSAFALPPANTFGNSGRDILRAPGYKNLDLGISKFFPLGENRARRIQFRAEMFNAFNNVNLGFPNTRIDQPTQFGKIRTAAPARIVQFGLRLEF